jgi:AraC-like DNA-binding protein
MASLAPEDFAKYSRALLETEVATPVSLRILRPSPGALGNFLRLHNQACQLAQTKPDRAAHPEIARALEQGLVHALINGVAEDDPQEPAGVWRDHSDVIRRFEQVLADGRDRSLSLPQLCAELGVAERTLRICCSQLLGMSPLRYARLRRLNLVRSALLRANPKASTVAMIAGTYGFSELGRFAAAYRAAFGETPSATLRRAGYVATNSAGFA